MGTDEGCAGTKQFEGQGDHALARSTSNWRLLMLMALMLLLGVIGKRTKRLAALIGGAGFGLFLDEPGKFVTTDKDCCFSPRSH